MIKLDKTFVSGDGGFPGPSVLTYTQLDRTDKVALYERSRNGKVYDYEVFYILIERQGHNTFGKITEEDIEKYPSTGKFGFTAWSITDRARALKRFTELCASSEIPEGEEEEKVEASKMIIPNGEWSTKELAETNKTDYPQAAIFLRESLAAGTVKFTRTERRNVKGKPTNLYSKA